MNWDPTIHHMLPSSTIFVGLRILRHPAALPVSMFRIMLIDPYQNGCNLSTAKTAKFSEICENGCVRYGLSSMQGWCTTMEDVIFNQAGPKSNPLPHSESQSSTSKKSTRLAVIFALSFTAVATLRLCSVWCERCRDLRCQDEDGWAEWVDSEHGRVISWFQQWLQEGLFILRSRRWLRAPYANGSMALL
ncbi:uncharacterized protein LOC103932276 isoform X2 [Pyrus x bretschneideri]|uniref:uncharacterized protein LOC103932276 isoform X2 n=1 Tax=Pyrus x bretschneideri TaxID=225117 RepID=UPI00202DCD5C|nr:uncharacterized protein LOC103932276 isoform X2 [Pyrus x bretschneideri]